MHNYYLLQVMQNELDVSLISSKNKENHSSYHQKDISYSGISADLPEIYWRIAKNGFIKNGLRSLQDWLISLALAKAIESDSPDIIEFMDIHSDGYAYLKRNPKKYRKTKVIIRSHTPWALLRSYYSNEERQGFDAWMSLQREDYCFQSCDGITTPSQDLKNHLIALYNLPEEKIMVIPNIVDTDHFMPLPRENNNQPFTFLHVGRFERAKGVVTLTKAFIEFAKVNKDCRLINIGVPRGSVYKYCHELLKSANLINKVIFAGFIPYDKLPAFYANADAVVVASEIYESFSYTVAQAMACGKPVLSSSIGGISETLNNGKVGLLYEAGNNNELIEGLTYLYNNNNLRKKLGNDARKYSVENFSTKKLKNIYLKYYKQIMIELN
jgi:glycosyltransferase involved in cell wall biosynthesis